MRDKKPAPVVYDIKGNASSVASGTKHKERKFRLMRACMTFWKAVAELKMRKLRAFVAWAHQTPNGHFKRQLSFARSKAPGPVGFTPLDGDSSFEEVD